MRYTYSSSSSFCCSAEVSKGFGNYRGGNSSSGGTCTSIVITLTCGPVVDILMGGLSLCFASVSKGLTTSAQQLQRSISSSSFSSSTNLITAPFRVLSRQNSLNINADNQNNNKRETNADSIPEKDWINVQGVPREGGERKDVIIYIFMYLSLREYLVIVFNFRPVRCRSLPVWPLPAFPG